MSRRGRVWQEGRAKGAPALRGAPWYFVVDVAPKGAPRRQVWRGGFPTKEAAERELAELLTSMRDGTFVEPSRTTFGDYLHVWLDGLETTGRRPTTIEGYRKKISRYVLPNDITKLPLQAVTAADLDKLYASLVTSGGRGGRKLSLRTVRHVHTIVGKALGDAERQDLLPRNPARRAQPPSAAAARSPEAMTWTPEQLARFLADTAGHPHGVLFRVAAMTGLRRGELCGLRWSDLDLAASRLVVRHTITTVNHRIVEGTVKTAKSRRSVDLDAETVRLLAAHRASQLEERLLVGAAYHDRGLVFARPDGEPWNPDSIGQAFERAVARVDLPRIRLHDLRHSHAVHLLTAGQNPRLVSERLGHASVGFTLDVYGHVMDGQQADAAAAVAALVDGSGHAVVRAL
jgi:integrase